MKSQTRLPDRTQFKRLLMSELFLITEIQLLILLGRSLGSSEATLFVDGALLFLGAIATAYLVAHRANVPLLLCGILPMVASLVQIFLSFGVEAMALTIFTVLLLADIGASLVMLFISLRHERQTSGQGWQ